MLACVLALLFGEVLLRAVEPQLTPKGKGRGRTRRVLYLRSQLWLGLRGGGSVAHTAGVIDGLEQLGVAVQVVSSDALTGVQAATRVVAPEMWFDGWLREVEDLAYNFAFFAGAWRAARKFKPQLIYQRHTAFNVTGALLAWALRVPLVLEFNSSEVWKGRYWGGLRLERAARQVERINLRAAHQVVVVSRVLRDELVANGIAASRVVVNPNGVDPRVFRPDAGGEVVRRRLALDSNVVVGFSGTFGEWHGIPTLARAVPLVVHARPNVRWLVMGDGSLRSLLDRSVREGDVADKVMQVGMLPHAEMPAHLAACDILVSPHGRQADGREFFGSPTKLYEYMAVGRPIVASRVGQIADVLQDEGSALLVEPDDAPALAAAIVRLVDDASLRARLGSAARAAAEERHTWRQNAARVLECVDHGVWEAESPRDSVRKGEVPH
jgi:glycosyltransferase involved in cell wall biosynthesis